MHTTRNFLEGALTLWTHISFASECATQQIPLKCNIACLVTFYSLMPKPLAASAYIARALLTLSFDCKHLEVRKVDQFITVRFWTVKESPLRLNNFSVNNMCLVKFDDGQLEQGMYFCF